VKSSLWEGGEGELYLTSHYQSVDQALENKLKTHMKSPIISMNGSETKTRTHKENRKNVYIKRTLPVFSRNDQFLNTVTQ